MVYLFIYFCILGSYPFPVELMTEHPPNELPSSQAKKIYFFAHVPFALSAAFSWLDLFHNIYMAFKGYAAKVKIYF